MNVLSRASRVVAIIILTASTMVAMGGTSLAATTQSQVTILPVCSDTQGNSAQWTVTNPNATPATVTWATDNSAQTATWTVPANDTNDTSLTTKFDTNDSAVKFVQNGVSQVISNIIPCQPNFQDTECIDASVPDVGLTEIWTARNTVQILTPDNVPICPGTLTLTSYTLPTGYDGGFFPGNATSVPQTVFATDPVTLTNTFVPYGEYQTFDGVTLTVKVPTDPCVNYRVSLDYGNLSGNVTTAAYGSNYLGGGLYQATSTCTKPVVKPVSTGHVLGANTTQPALVDTGVSNVWLIELFAAATIATALFIAKRPAKVSE